MATKALRKRTSPPQTQFKHSSDCDITKSLGGELLGTYVLKNSHVVRISFMDASIPFAQNIMPGKIFGRCPPRRQRIPGTFQGSRTLTALGIGRAKAHQPPSRRWELELHPPNNVLIVFRLASPLLQYTSIRYMKGDTCLSATTIDCNTLTNNPPSRLPALIESQDLRIAGAAQRTHLKCSRPTMRARQQNSYLHV